MSLIVPGKRVVAVLPAYNAAKTLARTIRDIHRDWIDDIILVDDASSDATVEIAKRLGLRVFVHDRNRGYGGNQKTCYEEALKLGADYVIMIHPDHQYDPRLVPRLLAPLMFEHVDSVFGSRMMQSKGARSGGMPWWKYIANKVLTFVANRALGLSLTEYHSGFRAYSRKVLEQLPFHRNSDDFVFDTEIIIQHKLAGMEIVEIPISTRYFPEASMIGFRRSVAYGLSILKNLCQYYLHTKGIVRYEKFDIGSRI